MTEAQDKLPLVAIIGRPNVGKSSLFNRIAGRGIAVVHKTPGVTRDRLIHTVRWGAKAFRLADTGGMEPAGVSDAAAEAQIRRAVNAQIQYALRDADVIIFTTDTQAGLMPLEEEAAQQLRRLGKPVFVAANKTDNRRLEDLCSDFSRLGFPVFPISALHFRGIPALMDAVTGALAESSATADDAGQQTVRVAVVGRPNVGKSSFLNALVGAERLIVSDTPCTTRDSVEIPFAAETGSGKKHYLLVDTAGIRRKRGPGEAVEFISAAKAEKSIAAADIAALMLDAAAGPTAQDKKIAALILEHAKGCVLLVNKWDLMRGVKCCEYKEALRRAVPFLDFAPVCFVSAKTGHNVAASLEVFDRAAACMDVRMPTPELNRAIRKACASTHLPAVQGRKMKIYYATQTGNRPPAVTLFVNEPAKIPRPSIQFVARVIREKFKLVGVPVLIRVRASHEKNADTEKYGVF